VRGVVRFGLLPVDLEASRDTPLFGDEIDRAVTSYNNAAAAYDQRFNTMTARADVSDLGTNDTLVTFAPGVEAGNSFAFVRAEAQLGLGDHLRSYGLGLYPLNLQTRVARRATAYLSAGGSASVLQSNDLADGVGALVTARAAGGVRISSRVTVEAGINAFMLGGIVDSAPYQDYRPAPNTPPPPPNQVVVAGEAHNTLDLNVGVVF
jgi:hypothetical protein